MASDKYKMFKQFMFNELEITKEDIREWIMEAVHEEVRKIVAKTYEDFSMEKIIRQELKASYTSIHQNVIKTIGEKLASRIKLNID